MSAAESSPEAAQAASTETVTESTTASTAEPHAGSGPEHRVTPRVPIAVEVTMESDHNFYAGMTNNISEGGVFVANPKPPKVGAKVELELALEQLPVRFTIKGEVRWIREFDADEMPAGCGIRFVEISQHAIEAIRAFIAKRDTLFYDE